jgi:hypothetical protein
MTLVPELTTPMVHGSIIRLNDDVILFAAPNNPFDDTRREITIWASYDDAQTWTTKRTVFFGYSAYSDMAVVGPDTVLVAYNRGWSGGAFIAGGSSFPRFHEEIALARVNLRWLESDEPYQFNYYFNDQAPGARANPDGNGVQDYGPWDQRARAYAFGTANAATYVAGPNGDTALEFKGTGSGAEDEVVLSTALNKAFQFDVDDSFTIELVMKTTDTVGVLLGTRITIKGWRLEVVNGKLRFTINDLTNAPTLDSDNAINDGQWHHVAVVRDATAGTISLWVDGGLAATPITDTTSVAFTASDPVDPVVLGAASDLSTASQLVFTVDTLRITRAALASGEFLPSGFVPPTPPPAPVYPENAPTSIPGLKLWLPPYDFTRYFGDFQKWADPLPLDPWVGMASRSALDLSPNAFRVATAHELRSMQYGEDATIGGYWKFTANSSAFGSELRIRNSSGGGVTNQNFDFIQNTGVFTLSAFINVAAETGGYQTIFDTNQGVTTLPGLSFLRQTDGRLSLLVTGGTPSTVRFFEATSNPPMAIGTWYHVVAVGSGPGNPVRFYVTPTSAPTVEAYPSSTLLGGADGSYTTNLQHDLIVGGRSGVSPGAQPFNGGMVNQTIFNRALTPLEIQQLFQHGKAQTLSGFDWLNQTASLDTNGDGSVHPFDLLLVVNDLIANGIHSLPEPTVGNAPPPYFDVSGNGSVEPLDALLLVNWLLEYPDGGGGGAGGGGGGGAGPQAAAPQTAAAAAAGPFEGSPAAPLSLPAATPLNTPSSSSVMAPKQSIAFALSFPHVAQTFDDERSPLAVDWTASVEAAQNNPTPPPAAHPALTEADAPSESTWRQVDSASTQTPGETNEALAVERFFGELGA